MYTTRVTAHLKEAEAVDYVCDVPFGEVMAAVTGGGPIYNGAVKMGWKVDWALRWFLLPCELRDVRGKDLIPRLTLLQDRQSGWGPSPPGFFYEMFLDEAGKRSPNHGVTGFPWSSG